MASKTCLHGFRNALAILGEDFEHARLEGIGTYSVYQHL